MARLALGTPVQRPFQICRLKQRSTKTIICQQQRKGSSGGNSNGSGGNGFQIDNFELLVGDTVGIISFATYKQIAAIVISPTFEGYLAPLQFNPIRFEEFFNFTITITATWAAAGILLGAYTSAASSDTQRALIVTCKVWLASMCISAAQLVLATAAEDGALVGTEGWGHILPLAASGPGEPFITAAQILGLMAVWRAFYATYLDISKFLSFNGARSGDNKETEARHFKDALIAALTLAVVSCVGLHFLSTSAFKDAGTIFLRF